MTQYRLILINGKKGSDSYSNLGQENVGKKPAKLRKQFFAKTHNTRQQACGALLQKTRKKLLGFHDHGCPIAYAIDENTYC